MQGLHESAQPRLARGYECFECVVLAGSASHGCGDAFGSVIGAQHLGCPMGEDSQVTQFDHVGGSHAPLNAQSQVLARELINDVTAFKGTLLLVRVELEIDGPHLSRSASPDQVL